MEAEYWHNRWKNNEIGFHESEANALLVKYGHRLNLKPGTRVFIPLCGKSLDIHWWLSQGFQVVGAELNPSAIEQLFAQLNVKPEIKRIESFTHYVAGNLQIFLGDMLQETCKYFWATYFN